MISLSQKTRNIKLTLDKLRLMVNIEGDAGIMFSGAVKLSPDFEYFVNSIYKNFVLIKPDYHIIDDFGLIIFQAWIELKKITQKIDIHNKTEYLNYISNSIILIHGYIIFFNQIFDDNGILEKEFTKRIKKKALEREVNEIEILSSLDSTSPLSLESIRYIKAVGIRKNKNIANDVKKLLLIKELFDDFKLQKVNLKLNNLYNSLSIKSNIHFSKFLDLFSLDCFPLLQAVRLLKQSESIGNKQSNSYQHKQQHSGLTDLQQIYNSIKFWKGITGLLANSGNMMFYFDIVKSFAVENKIELYSPIKKFLDKILKNGTDYKMFYNLDDINEAEMELKVWSHILDY